MDLAYDKQGRWLASAGGDGSVRIWERASGTERALLTTTRGSEDWLVVTREGLFDGSEEAMHQLVAWRIGHQMYPLDRFFADFFAPGLLAQIIDGERPSPRIDLARLRLPPEVRLVTPLAGKQVSQERVSVTVEARDLGGGIQAVRLYHNGKLIETRPSSRGQAPQLLQFELDLVGGENRLTALGISDDRVESNEDTVVLFYQPRRVVRPRLHLLAVGVNRYRDPSFNLAFARPDALAIAEYFKGRGGQLFRSVAVTTLVDESATAASVRKALDGLTEEALSEDVVIIYLAGHGVVKGQQFYFLTHGMTGSPEDQEALHVHGLPSHVLGQFVQRTKALKQILILDTCHSGSALSIIGKLALARGPVAAEKKALKMLARASGVYLIAASTAQQFAYEVKELGHGVLTYALLSGLGESGEPKVPTGDDGLVTVHALLQYINQVVPELTETYHGGNRQYPVSFNTGMDFPLVVR
jgi:hypothetical protein